MDSASNKKMNRKIVSPAKPGNLYGNRSKRVVIPDRRAGLPKFPAKCRGV